MFKLKTKSGAKKRFQVKKSGKVKYAKAFGKHMFTIAKTPANKRRVRGTSHLTNMDAKKVTKELFPYGPN